MDKKSSWTALFSLTPPTGVDLDFAAASLEGDSEVDPSVTQPKVIADRVDEFLADPATFIANNSTDTRVAQWTRLAKALGVIVGGSPTTTTTPSAASTISKQPKLTTAGLMGARIGATPKSTPSIPKSAPSVETPSPESSTPTTQPSPEPTPHGKDAARKTSKRSCKARPGFLDREDTVRLAGRRLREKKAAEKNETPRQRRDRLAAEAVEEERSFERTAAALKERLRILAEAEERKRKADFNLAAEQRRLDEEIEEQRRQSDLLLAGERRKLDDEAAARRLDREHKEQLLKLEREDKAAEQKLKREEEAEKRKRKREEDEEKRRREEELKPPKLTRHVLKPSDKLPPIVRRIVTSEPYTQGKSRIMPILEQAVAGDASATARLKSIKARLLKKARTGTGYMVSMSARHLLDLIAAYMSGKRFTDPAFKAQFETGIDP
jgi:hypothetical protein